MKVYFENLDRFVALAPDWIPLIDGVLATLVLILLIPLFGTLSLLLRAETHRASIKREITPFDHWPLPVTRFETRRLDGSRGYLGRVLCKSGLDHLPGLIDVAAGRLPLALLAHRQERPGQRRSALAKAAQKDRHRPAA
jgi:hypothetical protein